MKTSEELAQECLRLAGDEFVSAVTELTQLIDQDRSKQREACGKEAYLMARDLDVSGMVSKRIEQACLNAGVEE